MSRIRADMERDLAVARANYRRYMTLTHPLKLSVVVMDQLFARIKACRDEIKTDMTLERDALRDHLNSAIEGPGPVVDAVIAVFVGWLTTKQQTELNAYYDADGISRKTSGPVLRVTVYGELAREISGSNYY